MKKKKKAALEKAAQHFLASQAVSTLPYKMPILGTSSQCHTPCWKEESCKLLL